MPPRFSKDPQVEQSLRHSVKDGVAFSVMVGGGESYFSAFALHLKATPTEVGILATLPMLIGSFAQLLSALLGKRLARRRTLILTGAALQVLAWLPLALVPLLYPKAALLLLLGCLIFYYAAGQLITPQWSCLMGDLVPEHKRGRYFAFRTRLSSVTSFAALVGAGFLLHQFADAGYATAGFLLIFAIAAAARLVSLREMAAMHDPDPQARPATPPPYRTLRHFPSAPIARFSLFFALMQGAVGLAGPFFSVYMLRELELSYLQYTTLLASSVLLQVITLGMWGRIADAFGNRLVLLGTGFAMPLIPALWLLDGGFGYLVGVQAMSGLVWGGFTLAAGNFCYDLIPTRMRAPWMAMHNLLSNGGLFVGALVGAWLVRTLPSELAFGGYTFQVSSSILLVFLISSLLRMVVALSLLPGLIEARRVRPLTMRRLAFRATRLRWTLGHYRSPRRRRGDGTVEAALARHS